ncbi:MAG: preprotein translocase subunit SecE [Pirellulaceae bacterium]
MAKQKAMTANSLFGEIFQVGLYKPSQGRMTRQVTCGTIWMAIAIASYRLYVTLVSYDVWQYIIPLALLVIGFWASYRMVNYARFADFLIAVEAEMNKVSWPSRAELARSSAVVIFVIFALALILFGFDFIWRVLFQWLNILR